MSRHVPEARITPVTSTSDRSMATGPEARAWLTAYADRLLAGVRPYASPSGSLITLPGKPGGYGTAVDGLEGFARTFLLAGFRLAGENGEDPTGLAERYAAGLAAGTDPAHPERWTRPEEHGQAKVEAASLALILDMTRPWIWDRLSPDVQERTVEYLASVVGDLDYPDNNWVWFRIVVETFLRSVGGPFSADDMVHDLAAHDRFRRPGGWFADGPERSYDHYAGWALHLYPVLHARLVAVVTAVSCAAHLWLAAAGHHGLWLGILMVALAAVCVPCTVHVWRHSAGPAGGSGALHQVTASALMMVAVLAALLLSGMGNGGAGHAHGGAPASSAGSAAGRTRRWPTWPSP